MLNVLANFLKMIRNVFKMYKIKKSTYFNNNLFTHVCIIFNYKCAVISRFPIFTVEQDFRLLILLWEIKITISIFFVILKNSI